MKLKLALLTFALLTTIATSYKSCDKSICLGYNADLSCRFCNNDLGYINNGFGQCALNSIEHCLQVLENGCCARCETNFVPFGGSCRYFEKTDCLRFDDMGDCIICPTGFAPIVPRPLVVNKDTLFCQQLSAPLANCQYQSSETVCLHCATGYIFDGTACTTQDVIADCLVMTSQYCASCPAGYKLLTPTTDGKSISYGLSVAITFQTTVELESRCVLDIPNSFTNTAAPIIPTQIPHCSVYTNAGTCQRCEDQYYINSVGQCVKSTAPVPNCLVYGGDQICAICTNETFPTNGGTVCSAVGVDIQYCKCYSSYTTCEHCDDQHYLDADGTCKSVTTKPECDIYDSN